MEGKGKGTEAFCLLVVDFRNATHTIDTTLVGVTIQGVKDLIRLKGQVHDRTRIQRNRGEQQLQDGMESKVPSQDRSRGFLFAEKELVFSCAFVPLSHARVKDGSFLPIRIRV